MNKGHVHAELMAQYAQDALETDRPWERWQSCPDSEWYTLCKHPCWSEGLSYRRKPTQVRVAGEVFDDVLLSEPIGSEHVYVITSTNNIKGLPDRQVALSLFKEGRVHTTYEGALRHLEALKPKVL